MEATQPSAVMRYPQFCPFSASPSSLTSSPNHFIVQLIVLVEAFTVLSITHSQPQLMFVPLFIRFIQ